MKLKAMEMLQLCVIICLGLNAVIMAGTSNEDKLIYADDIVAAFEQGKERTRVIVKLAEPPEIDYNIAQSIMDSLKSVQAEIEALELPVLSSLDEDDFKLRHRFENIAAFSGDITPEGFAQLLRDPRVELIEPAYELQPCLKQGISLINGNAYRSQYAGAGTAIAICDSGIDYTHPRLGGGGFPNSKIIGGRDISDNDNDPMDYNGHGTNCAGVAAGILATSGDYVGGVAHAAKLYALKVQSDDGSGTGDDIIKAWEWCITHQYDDPENPILVISTSMTLSREGIPIRNYSSCDSSSSVFTTIARRAVEHGITLLCSSGNHGWCDSLGRPACLGDVISVGSVYDAAFVNESYPCITAESCAPTKTYIESGCPNATNPWSFYYAIDHPSADSVPSYSNTASFLDIFAPANNATTTNVGGGYTDFGGTSAACPYAAGAVACMQSAALARTSGYLTPSEVRDILALTGDNVTDSKAGITKPRINLGRAINNIGPVGGGGGEERREVVFEDTFPGPSVNRDKWPVFHNAEISNAGRNEPSGNYSLRLNGNPSADDRVESRVIDLSSFSGATLTYSYEKTGNGESPDLGDDLIFSYWTGSTWKELDRQYGYMPDMQHYRDINIELPPAAMHAGFKLQIRSLGTADTYYYQDDWFVDDVKIEGWVGKTIVFEDKFPSMTRDATKWPHVDGAAVDGDGQNPPSPPYSLHLRASNLIRSLKIDMSSFSGATLSYQYQRTGAGESPDEDDDLTFSYWDGGGWREITRHFGLGPDMLHFTPVTKDLPPGAFHKDFMLLIEGQGDWYWYFGEYDDWFVDDVMIEAWR